jgi:hypothetical protein
LTLPFDRLDVEYGHLKSRKALDSRRKQKQFSGYNYKPLNQVRSLRTNCPPRDESNTQALRG